MQIPFSLTVLGLERDPMQSLSTFYNVVKKLEHFEAEIFAIGAISAQIRQ